MLKIKLAFNFYSSKIQSYSMIFCLDWTFNIITCQIVFFNYFLTSNTIQVKNNSYNVLFLHEILGNVISFHYLIKNSKEFNFKPKDCSNKVENCGQFSISTANNATNGISVFKIRFKYIRLPYVPMVNLRGYIKCPQIQPESPAFQGRIFCRCDELHSPKVQQ